jgi:preprotein translocase subunit YajC
MKKFFLLFPLALFADDGAAQGGGGTQMLVMLGLSALFLYFMMWRPESKRRKAAEAMRSKMKKGDGVIAMGIRGVISLVKEDSVVIRLIEGAKMEILKAAITEVTPSSEAESAAAE